MSSDVPTYDYFWEQGADLNISIIYKVGTLGNEQPVDLSGYNLRMDIVSVGTRVYTFNSADITDLDGASGPGSTSDTTKEGSLGSDGSITIAVPRSLTLPGGAIHTQMAAGKNVFDYDMFLRTAANKQTKILSGKVTVNPSVTLWE